MKQRLIWICVGVMAAAIGARAGEENFSTALRAEDYAAAGLAKLTPAERARLDALVRDYKSGALEAARREADAARQAKLAAESRAAKAEAEAREKSAAAAAAKTEKSESVGRSLLGRAKVLLTPGTEIEYSTVESRIVGTFRGWERQTIFTLENGQRWKVTDTEGYFSPPIQNPAVKIAPGTLGSFWITIEGVRPRAKVQHIGGGAGK